jgi:parallel beta-helix repeat protein
MVLVAPGIYVENIDFRGKNITVTSEAGPEVTVIDGNAAHTVVRIRAGAGPGAVLRGFTIRNGAIRPSPRDFSDGSGVEIGFSSPTIENNWILENIGLRGGGVSVQFGFPLIRGNVIRGNQARGGSGGGIAMSGQPPGQAQILDNLIEDNIVFSGDGGGISLSNAGSPVIRGNIIRGNRAGGILPCSLGGGISLRNSDASIVQNLIAGNRTGCGGGIGWFGRGPLVINNTIVNNDGSQGSGIFAAGFDPLVQVVNNLVIALPGQRAVFCDGQRGPMIAFNDVWSEGGAAYGGNCPDQTGIHGNLSADPKFVDPRAGDYRLQRGSPVIDAGDNGAPDLPTRDLDGNPRVVDGDLDSVAIVDMGAFEFVPPVLEVAIEIKPGSALAVINVASRGVVPVAILGSATFDASEIEPTTLRFGPAGAGPAHANGPRLEDVNGDRELDLLAHFRVPETGIAMGDSEACATGALRDTTLIRGCDEIRTLTRGSVGRRRGLARIAGGMGAEIAWMPGLALRALRGRPVAR